MNAPAVEWLESEGTRYGALGDGPLYARQMAEFIECTYSTKGRAFIKCSRGPMTPAEEHVWLRWGTTVDQLADMPTVMDALRREKGEEWLSKCLAESAASTST